MRFLVFDSLITIKKISIMKSRNSKVKVEKF